jgi:hypothetical protein
MTRFRGNPDEMSGTEVEEAREGLGGGAQVDVVEGSGVGGFLWA